LKGLQSRQNQNLGQGQCLIVEGGWYGHKTAAATFHTQLAAQLRKMGFVPTKADLDLWIRKAKDECYEYIASYVDDIIVISNEPMELITPGNLFIEGNRHTGILSRWEL
jgi:hypothetical protein